jgi:DNA-binding helix-hairpin-helix protein with protein kinase domain
MLMMFHGLHSERYVTSRELGRGGEGTVFELQNHPGIVLKKYNEPLTDEKISKLRKMVAMRSPAIESYAAWPIDVVTDDRGITCGFVMRKLAGYVPLHRVFSPMDRKKLFPEKGYNFLAHVARNLSAAFFKLHEAGLVVGDVNEGNILISSSGLVSFIDCDSFQVKSDNGYFFCEVGVPRYTPPELLKGGSFDSIIRTANTDSFSLAVLVFQLLFLGRHPFAGKHKLAADIDEEAAIRKHEFAYSLENKKKKLSPPADSFSISNLPDHLVRLFHQAFEQDERPAPADWIRALDELLAGMVTCGESALHTYPEKLAECPWCAFRKTRGILYFLDDSYIKASVLLSDIESFVNGFQPEKLELKKWEGAVALPPPAPSPVENKYRTYRALQIGISALVAAAGMAFSFSDHTHIWAISLAVFLPVIIYKYSPWAIRLRAELSRRTDYHKRLEERLRNMIAEHDNSPDTNSYAKGLDILSRLIHDFRRLPDELEHRKKIMEEQLYNEQLDWFLYRFDVAGHTIPSFGAAKKDALIGSGIRTAADISKLQTLKVPGIGPKNREILFSWRRQLSTEFVYIPDSYKIASGLQRVNSEIEKIKANLELLIRKEYQALNYLKINITSRAVVLEKQIIDLSIATRQAAVDRDAFRAYAR